jgi:transcriptional regulator with XRE-family HTH domain
MRLKRDRSKLAQKILEAQGSARDREVAERHGWLQQTYNRWKNGGVPRPDMYASLAAFLGVDRDEVESLVLEARDGAAASPVPKTGVFNTAKTYGRVTDRKEGKYAFEPFNQGRKRIPEGRYWIHIDTKVMEPALPVGTRAWIDPAVWPKPGYEVLVHAAGGSAWIGRLVSLVGDTAEIERYAAAGLETMTVRNVAAVHSIILSERVASM